ncbi:hypothetical protein ACS0TY_012525 [Phlomoides rotata]
MWKARNDTLWNHASIPAVVVIYMARSSVTEWTSVHQALISSRAVVDCTEWHKPAPSFFKLNVNEVDEGEAMGLYEALSWIKGLGLNYVEVETSAKLVANAIRSTPFG